MIYAEVLIGAFLKAFDLGLYLIPLLFLLVVVLCAVAPERSEVGARTAFTAAKQSTVGRTVLWSSGFLALGMMIAGVLSVGNVILLTDLVIDNIDVMQKAGAVVLLVFIAYAATPGLLKTLKRSESLQAAVEGLFLILIGMWIMLLNVFAFDHRAYDPVTMPPFFATDHPRVSHSPLTAIVFQVGYIAGIDVLVLLLHFLVLRRIRSRAVGRVVFVVSVILLVALSVTAIVSMDTFSVIQQMFGHEDRH